MTGPHPLEPLGPDELAQAVTVLRDAGHLPQRTDIIDLSLHEPPRDAVQGWAAGTGSSPVVPVAWLSARIAGHSANVSHSCLENSPERKKSADMNATMASTMHRATSSMSRSPWRSKR